MVEDVLTNAINLIKAGKKSEAAAILEPHIRANPHDIQAWLWEVETRETMQGKIKILELCLQRNPDEPEVTKALALLKSRAEESSRTETPIAFPPQESSQLPLPESYLRSSESETIQVNTPKLKPCPYCAEMIQANAIVCRFCGRDFRTGTVGAPTYITVAQPIKPKKWYMETWVKVLTFLFITPLWTLIVLEDPDSSTGVKVVAGVLLVIYVLFVCPAIYNLFLT